MHLESIRDAVQRVHRIVMDATELMSLHLSRCLEDNVSLPMVTQDWIKTLMMEVSMGGGKRTRVDMQAVKTREQYMASLQPTDRKKLDQLLMSQSKVLDAAFHTNIRCHFPERLKKFVRLHHSTDNVKIERLDVLKVVSDVLRNATDALQSHEQYHAWITEWRHVFRFETFEGSMNENYKSHSSSFLRATWLINRALEDGDKHCLSICPIRRSLKPCFIQIDTDGLRRLLPLDKTYEHEQQRKRSQKNKQHERIRKLRDHLGLKVIPRVRLDKDVLRIWTPPLGGHTAAIILQRWWKQSMIKYMTQPTEEHVRHLQDWVRKWIQKKKQKELDHKRRREAAKGDTWSEVLSFTEKGSVKQRKGFHFAGSIRTDGVSIRLLFKKQPSKTSSPIQRLPRCGLYTIDTIKHLARQEAYQVIGGDPGKRELLVCTDVDGPPDKNGKAASVRYTSGQRSNDMCTKPYHRMMQKETPPELLQCMRAQSEYNSRSSYLETLSAYFGCRRRALQPLLQHFSQEKYRKRQWKRFIKRQKSTTDFVRRIRSLQMDKEVPLMLAYGSWGGIAGRPGHVCNKGNPPCPGIGLRSELSKHFLVVSTPEYNTSKTCSICQHECGPCKEVDEWHRPRKYMEAKTFKERNRAMKFSVRGMRRCCNVECAAFLNRDHNAAVNIGHRLRRILDNTLDSRDELCDYEKVCQRLEVHLTPEE